MIPANFEFEYSWFFWVLPLPLLVYLIIPPLRQVSTSLKFPNFIGIGRLTGEKAKKRALIKRRHFLNWIVFFLIWVLLIVGMASPVLVGKPEMEVKTSRNFLILADISFSMAKKDWFIEGERVSRWDAVKDVVHAFIGDREGDRMGIVFFASSAYIQVPFTPDLPVVDQLLDEADVGMAGQMTNIGKAIMKGKEMFDKDTIQTKVTLLITDGVDSGTDILPLDAADLAARDSIKVYTLGIGDPDSGNSDLDEKTLIQIAEQTGGKYFRAMDTDVLKQVSEELNTLEPIEFKEAKYKPKTYLYYYPVGLAVLLALIELAVMTVNSLLKKRREQ
ncbi:MAG: VWA domain-containing protein [Flavobacteriaceae bacterium]